ncbi:hypothetical protein MRL31_04180 [Morganella morganii]
MQNDRQSPETVILGVDTHLDIHVGAVISQAGKLLGTHIIQTNQAGYLELLDWYVLSGASNEQASKEQEYMVPH